MTIHVAYNINFQTVEIHLVIKHQHSNCGDSHSHHVNTNIQTVDIHLITIGLMGKAYPCDCRCQAEGECNRWFNHVMDRFPGQTGTFLEPT